MAHILHSTIETTTATVTEQDGSGNPVQVEHEAPRVQSVTFMIDKSTPHTLIFLDKGIKIKDGRGVERVVGDPETPHYVFATAEEAVNAYLNGQV